MDKTTEDIRIRHKQGYPYVIVFFNINLIYNYINTYNLTRRKIRPYSCYADNLLFLFNGIMTFGMDFVTFR